MSKMSAQLRKQNRKVRGRSAWGSAPKRKRHERQTRAGAMGRSIKTRR